MLGPNTGLGHNSIVWMLECQANYITQFLEIMIDKNHSYVDVKMDALNEFYDDVQKRIEPRVFNSNNCRSWYQAKDGTIFALWYGHTYEYWWKLRNINLDHFNIV